MNFRANTRRRRIRVNVDLTPLINVIFLLLLFFVFSSTFVVETSVHVEVPQAEVKTTLEQRHLSITLQDGTGGPDNEGRVYVDTDEMNTWADLSSRLSKELEKQPDLSVLIRPDAHLDTGRLVKVLGLATSVGVQHYGIAAAPNAPAETP